MTLSNDTRAALIVATRQAASSFLEDIEHIRSVARSPYPTKGEVRRLSNPLRRLLVNGELESIAAPRVGKVKLSAPDNKALYAALSKVPVRLFASFGAQILGRVLGPLVIEDDADGRPKSKYERTNILEMVSVSAFLSQKIFYARNTWFTRQQAIKYAAIYGGGVHSKTPTESPNYELSLIDNSFHYNPTQTETRFQLDIDPLYNNRPKFAHDPKALTPVFLEILATAQFLSKSDSLYLLEAAIRDEMFALSLQWSDSKPS